MTIRARSITAAEALERVLRGTSVKAKATCTGTVVLVKAEETAETCAREGAGALVGNVSDAADHRPLRGVQVIVLHTSLLAVTNDSGFYALRGVPTGLDSVVARFIRYTPGGQTAMVADSQVVHVDFTLGQRPTRLAEVVTTATGQQRRIELGNDITILARYPPCDTSYVSGNQLHAPARAVSPLHAARPGIAAAPP